MIEKNSKITEATENELFKLYLDREMDLVMSFPENVTAMRHAGCTVHDSKSEGQG